MGDLHAPLKIGPESKHEYLNQEAFMLHSLWYWDARAYASHEERKDPGKWLLWSLSLVGQVTGLKRARPEVIAAKRAH